MEPRRALVTGGASGLGYGVVKALLHTGAWVAMGDIDEDGLRRASAELNHPRVLPLSLDVASRDSVQAAVERSGREFGGLDTLVNCAGIFAFRSLEELKEEDWDRLLDINLKGVYLCCQAAAPLLRVSGRGRIVNISSDAGKKGFPLIAPTALQNSG